MSRSKQRKQWSGQERDIIPFVRSLPAGTKFRIFFAWNGSYHDAHYYAGIKYGPAIRRPQTIEEVARRIKQEEDWRIKYWEFSRNAT